MKTFLTVFLIFASSLFASAQVKSEQAKALFSSINLEQSGLKKVKAYVEKEQYTEASTELLKYFRKRKNIKHPEVNRENKADYAGKKVSKGEQKKANDGLMHKFFVHKGYESFDYGVDINWQHWPVKDNEVRWQLHRMYWWIPMGKMYWSTRNERYAEEWIFQFRDWIKDNPRGLSKENDRFAWRQLETSRRVQDLTSIFNYFIDSEHFTPDFLIEFLASYHQHAERVREQYSAQGNHLLFEAQRMIYAGGFFPEFKNAPIWRKEGIDILNKEIKKQVFADGYQYELSPNYHVGCIEIFLRALRMAQLCGIEKEFPQSYENTVESMIMANISASYPNATLPMFGDAKLENAKKMQKKYTEWLEVFPNNEIIRYFASKGKEGNTPNYLSKALDNCGFYTFRNGWDKKSTVMIMKAGPSGHFHCQPDNGTFELWYKGTNLMPDAGCYVYSGNEEIKKMREWYRQTRVHQTLTLNNENINLGAKQLYYKTSNKLDVAQYENPSYDNLKHKRTVFFVDKKFFVILDEAIGDTVGTIDLHFQVKEGKVVYEMEKNRMVSNFTKEKNVAIQSFSLSKIKMVKEDLKVSYHYRKEKKRAGISFQQEKTNKDNIQYVTVVYPFEGLAIDAPKLKAEIKENEILVVVNKKKYKLDIPTIK